MKNYKIIFLNHASFILLSGKNKILVDPYLFGKAFNNGWSLLQEVDHEKEIKNVTHIFFSHEHPDHFSIPFLKKIKPENRNFITILYQDTFDKRVKNFCKNLGFKFIELPNGREIQINKDIEVCVGKVPFFDSWINFKVGGKNILNVNDCVLENINLVHKIKKTLNRKIDALFTQFSYANFIEESKQKIIAKKQLQKIKIQDQVLKPDYIVPFASFIYFSHVENKFMNKNINKLENVHEYILNECKARPIILQPNETWLIENKSNNSSLAYWNKIYGKINDLNYDTSENSIPIEELKIKSKNYLQNLKFKNNKFLISFLTCIHFFPKIIIFVEDLNKYFLFDLIAGLVSIKDNGNQKYVALNSNSLLFIFQYDYGFDTLLVNARLKCDQDYIHKVIRCFVLGSLNNTGRFMNFFDLFKFFDLNFLKRGLEVLGFKQRKF
jgi:UDP-MurNAc hydroxylase